MRRRQSRIKTIGSNLDAYPIDLLQPFGSLELLGDFGGVRYHKQRNLLFVTNLKNQVDDVLLMAGVYIGGRLIG